MVSSRAIQCLVIEGVFLMVDGLYSGPRLDNTLDVGCVLQKATANLRYFHNNNMELPPSYVEDECKEFWRK